MPFASPLALLPKIATGSQTGGASWRKFAPSSKCLFNVQRITTGGQHDRMDLTYLKDFTDAYANFTFKRGQLYLSTELAMEDGNYNEYMKPVMEY